MLRLLTVYTFYFTFALVSAHSALWHPSMWGFNVTDKTFPYDNRPVAPLRNKTFNEWWFHNHLAHPPNPGDFFELPAGGQATAEIACTKDATSFWNIAPDGGRNVQQGDNVCPNSPTLTYHTNGIDDLEGCALAIAYKSNVEDVKPEDFTIFSVNHTCVWTRFTDFQVPTKMPECPDGGCICSFFWIHSPDAGGEENYMNGFRCKITNATSEVALAKPAIPRRCGEDPKNNKQFSAVQNCTYGAKQPLYWLNDNSNMFEGEHAPPVYNDLYNFADGAQDDIFEDSYKTLPQPGVVATLPVFARDKDLLPPPLKTERRFLDMFKPSNHLSESSEVDPRLFKRYVPRYLIGMTYPSGKLN
ncbi:hypothetical protein AGABI1DRAFT_128149 [Agaricus bisporus var. burnettii JB137-S8]|uniref:Uncharacterized protein n=1 Tax=Agaricus bisporus var. burnettii (strain JB137-S8 / ATCC MYA-4627 / FGSC 10392) TaxID=597362 RepID=K5XYM6_AGABU|nr:uncharacterized protein AGABI1DRAFT_128149 [Agaricus bisporus var. burnettii JB137-S8]EKM80475.1 hypothetical protein AGABI1DRAFT_128149 [Agaricus bisporus var. burnettii JB137-S8]